MTTKEVAELLGVSAGTVRNWRIGDRPMRLPYVILNDGYSIRYERCVVEEFAANRNSIKARVEVDHDRESGN